MLRNWCLMRGLESFVRSLFASEQQGAWYDPSDMSTLFQDAAGATPVTAIEQPVGLMLDKRLGAVRGPELIVAASDRDFSADTGFWTKSAGWVISGGVAAKSGATGANLFRTGLLTLGLTYEVSVEIVAVSGTLTVFVGVGTSLAFTTTGIKKMIVVCTGDTTLYLQNPDANTSSIDNISVKPLDGNHVRQATAASRPVLSARVNLVLASDTFGTPWVTSNSTFVGGVLTRATAGSESLLAQTVPSVTAGFPVSYTVRAKPDSAGFMYLRNLVIDDALPSGLVTFNLNTGAIVFAGTSYTGKCSITAVGDGSYDCSAWGVAKVAPAANRIDVGVTDTVGNVSGAAGLTIRPIRAQHTITSLPVPHQRVNTATDYDTAGFPMYGKSDGVDDSMSSATGGGGTAGFFFCQAIKPTGGAGAVRTLLSDSGTNSGYRVQLNATNQLSFSAGNGTAYTTAATATATVIGTTHLLTVWDDGTNLNVQLDSGTVATIARPVVTAGTAGFTLGKDNGAATGFFNGNLYPEVYRQGSGLTAAERAQVQAYVRSKAAL